MLRLYGYGGGGFVWGNEVGFWVIGPFFFWDAGFEMIQSLGVGWALEDGGVKRFIYFPNPSSFGVFGDMVERGLEGVQVGNVEPSDRGWVFE